MSQCPAIHPTRSGAVFCTKEEGHEGEHRGYRKRWTGDAPGRVPLAARALVALRSLSDRTDDKERTK